MRTLVLLSLLTFIGCTSQNSQKELELLQRENELLKKEKELAEQTTGTANKEKPKPQNRPNKVNYYSSVADIDSLSGSGNIQDSPIIQNDNSKLAQKLRRLLIGHEFKKGNLSWKFVGNSEIDELEVTNHYKGQDGIEYAQINVVLNDIYGKGGRYYGKLLITYVDNILTEIQPIEYYKL